jgi:hypothetical protein
MQIEPGFLKLNNRANTSSMQSHVNDVSRPVIFLGSNSMLHKLTETCEQLGIAVHGIIDRDYWGNTDSMYGVPVVDSEESFLDPERLAYYRDNFHFFCATNWIPEQNDISIRNYQKRMHLLDCIQQHQLPCVSLVDPSSQISRHATIGQGVYIDWNVQVNAGAVIGDFTNIYCGTVIGHDNLIGRNCVFQRHSMLIGDNIVGDNVYFGLCVKALKPNAQFGSGTVIHEAIYIRRGTVENEVVSLTGTNLNRINPYPFIKE